MSTHLPNPTKVKPFSAWWIAIRPKTLPAALSPVLVGIAYAIKQQNSHLLSALAALFGALLLQILSNLANDYFDFKKGADTPDRLGPLRAAASGLLTLRQLQWAMVFVIVLSLTNGIYLIQRGGWFILLLGLTSLLAAILYTGSRFAFGYKGLGDVFVFIFFGPLAVLGTVYVQSQHFSWLALLLGIPIGCLITAILVVNNIRDITSDRQAGKWTLVARWGIRFGRLEYMTLLVISYFFSTLLAFFQSNPALLLPLLSLPKAIVLMKKIWQSEPSPIFNLYLASTAQLSFFYAALFAVGLFV